MKNRKFKFILASLLILISTSCANDPLENNEITHLDGVTFNQLTTFVYNDTNYSLAIPNNDETYYLYKESSFTSSCIQWTINYTVTNYYLYDKHLNEDQQLFDQIQQLLLDNIDKINSTLDEPITSVYKHNEEIIVEETLTNTLGDNVSFMYYDWLLPIRLINNDTISSYNISIILNRKHLLSNKTSIVSPIDGSIIDKDSFELLDKTFINKYY